MVTITRAANDAPEDIAVAFEAVVRELLAGIDEPLEVKFRTCEGEDGRILFVCRVEAPPADPFGLDIQWRWWSPLLEGAEALRESLGAAVSARRARSAEPRVAMPSPAASPSL